MCVGNGNSALTNDSAFWSLISGIVSAPRGAAVLGVRDGPFSFPTAFDIRPQSDGVHKTDTLRRDGRPRADKADSSPSRMQYLSLSLVYTHAETKWKDTHQIGSCDRTANVFPCKVKGQSMRPHSLLLMTAHPEHAPAPLYYLYCSGRFSRISSLHLMFLLLYLGHTKLDLWVIVC